MNPQSFHAMLATPRIAFISGLGLGGAATFLCNLAGELVRRNVPVIVVSPEKENAFASDFQAAGVKVVLNDDRRNSGPRLWSAVWGRLPTKCCVTLRPASAV